MPKSLKELDNLLSDEDDEDDTSSSQERACQSCGSAVPSEAEFCPKCGAKQERRACCAPGLRCCCCCCLCTLLCTVLGIVLLVVFLNHVVAASITSVGGALLGVDVTVGSVDIDLWSCHVGIQQLDVCSPEGYEDKLLQLDTFMFDFNLQSVYTAWMSDFTEPVILRPFDLINLNVTVDMKAFPFGESNAQVVVDHLNEVIKIGTDQLQHAHEQSGGWVPSVDDLTPTAPKPTLDQGVKAAYAMVKSKRIHIENISAGVRISTLPTVTYTLQEILLTDVGKEGKGVHVYELVDMLVRAILMSVIKGAPSSIRSNLANGFGSGLWREMNFAGLNLNSGQGLVGVGNFVGWMTAESALLNTRLAVDGAELSAQAAAMGAEMNLEAMKAGVTMSTEAASLGVRASMAAATASAQATLTGAKMASDLTTGFTNGLTSIIR